MSDIHFRKNVETKYMGRNGVGACKGLIVRKFKDMNNGQPYTYIVPINSKGNAATKCSIEIPEDSIPEVTKALQKSLLDLVLSNIDRDQLPKIMGLDPVLDKEIAAQFAKED